MTIMPPFLNSNMTLYMIFSIYLLFIIPKSTSLPSYLYNFCPNTTFAPNTNYATNLNTLLHTLASNVATNPTSFYITSAGKGTSDAVYGLFLCRGDQNVTACRDCVKTATTTDLPHTYCPNSKVATIWYDECMVRYSNVSIFGKLSIEPKVSMMNSEKINGNQTRFGDFMKETMGKTAVETANNRSGIKFTAKTVNFTRSIALYALQQCTPDLTPNECSQCLTRAITQLSVMQGSRVLQPSCNVRYEIYPFYNGAVNYSASSVYNNSVPPFVETTGKKKKLSNKMIIIIVIAIVVAIPLKVLAITFCFMKKRAKNYHHSVPIGCSEDFTIADSLQYDLDTLQSATNNFSDENKLGEGGFGGVYKGILSNGQEIAVKRLSKSSDQGVEEFKSEVLLAAKLQHRNLVRLLGFCLAGEEKLLVYEYIPNKSLDHFLFDPEKREQLDWGKRYKIIRGVARGMLYLHQDSRLRIIHRDLKVSNVLLDKDLNSKVSDFGMARIFGVDQSQGNTSRVVGTYGYMSPEYAMHGQFSVKSDVYSFGVLVLEIVSGKRNSSFYQSGYAEDLLSYAWKKWRDGTPLEFVDETVRNSCSIHEVMRCMHLGLLCVQECTDDRPTMATSVLMLDSHSITLPMPKQPAFFIKSYMKSKNLDELTSNSTPWSMNDLSVTEAEAR